MAEAYHGYNDMVGRFKFWDPKQLTYQFMAEIRRLWQLEVSSGQPRITTLQASMVICAAYSTTGLDKLSSDYFTQGIGMAKKMGLLGPLSYLKKPLRRKVYNMTAWALYGYQGLLAFHMWRALQLTEEPEEPLPNLESATEQFGEM
ncbi:hypothetical protein BN1723_015972 [Verticillium longisporum]|uniref:Transcription factor domain-containing protein n=1 Tax=Verticillium longisporum TaxID=100787 RepID=A0A0G4N5X5_VERLO|nr:hypothetical protein BN1723_015972 [Verticillium longisporum]